MLRVMLGTIGLLAGLILSPLQAQQLSVLGGGLRQHRSGEHTRAWSLEYQQRLAEHAALGLVYLNEGHPDSHHRDGIGLQAWARSAALTSGLSLAAGIGPYYYFDTTSANSADHLNEHDWGLLASVAATWQLPQNWSLLLRANRLVAHDSFNTSSLLLGLGYRFDDRPVAAGLSPSATVADGQELMLSAGQIIVNSFDSERAPAFAVEYRRTLGRDLDWTLSWLDEGDAVLLRRRGVAAQLWLLRPLLDGRLTLGIGAGPYLATDHDRSRPGAAAEHERLTGLLSLGARYRLSRHVLLRFSWSRVLTDYHRDADLLLLGIGTAF